MKSPLRTALISLMIGLLAILLFTDLRPREPVYQSRPLSAWLDDLMKGRDGLEHDSAEEAIRQMGTNSIPTLLSLISSEESRVERNLRHLSTHLEFLPYTGKPVGEHRERARRAFAALGPLAKPAIPQLRALLNNESCSKDVAAVLYELGPAGEAAIAKMPTQ